VNELQLKDFTIPCDSSFSSSDSLVIPSSALAKLSTLDSVSHDNQKDPKDVHILIAYS
jgi:hypothetical protein